MLLLTKTIFIPSGTLYLFCIGLQFSAFCIQLRQVRCRSVGRVDAMYSKQTLFYHFPGGVLFNGTDELLGPWTRTHGERDEKQDGSNKGKGRVQRRWNLS